MKQAVMSSSIDAGCTTLNDLKRREIGMHEMCVRKRKKRAQERENDRSKERESE
jgi:hypothetical protein